MADTNTFTASQNTFTNKLFGHERDQAGIVISAKTNENSLARASICLENVGVIAGYIYIENDGTLCWRYGGNSYKVNLTQL